MRSHFAIALAASIAAISAAPALADEPHGERVRTRDVTKLERSVVEPRRFPLRFDRNATGRADRKDTAPTPPVISGPFGAL